MGNTPYAMDRTGISGPDCGCTDEFLDARDFVTARTSGSTGTPKEIRLLKRDMIVSARATCRFFGIDSRSVMVCPLSADYIAGKMMIVRALVSGARLRMIRPAASPLQNLGPFEGEGRVALLPVVPAQVEPLLDDARLGLVDNLLIGGGQLPPPLAARIASLGISAWESYGMTETCSHVALRRVGSDRFTAMPGVSFSTDPRGCLVVDIPAMSIGRVVTNDIVELLSQGQFRWLGRHDNVINSGGVKIHPETDERLLAPALGASRFYITSRPSPRWGREAVMVVIDSPLTDADILAACRALLPRHHQPKAIIRDPAPSFTPSGKLKRRTF